MALRLPALLPQPGVRRSHLGIFLLRHAARPVDVLAVRGTTPERERLGSHLVRVIPRLSALQLLDATRVVVLQRLTSQKVQTALFKHLLLPQCGEAWLRRPQRLVAALNTLADCEAEDRFTGALSFAQHAAAHLAEHVEGMGKQALAVLCAVTRCGGRRALNRLGEKEGTQLSDSVAVQAGLTHEQLLEFSGLDRAELQARAARAVELFCAVSQLAYRDAAVYSLLSRYLADHTDDMRPEHLPMVARAIGTTGRDSSHNFVLLHSLCRHCVASMQALDGSGVVTLLQAFGLNDLYDEEFLAAASEHLQASAATLPVGQIGDAMYAYGSLKVQDAVQIDALCNALRPRANEIEEIDLVRFMKGLVKLRHFNEEVLLTFQPVIHRLRWNISPLSLTNLISSLSYFDAVTSEQNETFYKSLLHAATSRASRLQPMSIQHMLTSLFRLQRSLRWSVIEKPLERICAQLAVPGVAPQVTPVQAVASLTALSRLQHRDCTAAAVLTSVLAGRGGNVAWTWAPSAYFYAHSEKHWVDGPALDEKGSLRILGPHTLDHTHIVDVIQSLQRLDLHGALASRVVLRILGRLLPQLHELRAREVLVVARSMSAWRFPGNRAIKELPEDVQALLGLCEEVETEADSPAPWRECVVERCLENLRRHEHFLEVSWQTLLPLKLLCLEIDAEVYGTRALCDILSPSLLSFVTRLRGLTRAEVEANRLQKEQEEEEGGPTPAAAGDSMNKGVAAIAPGAAGGSVAAVPAAAGATAVAPGSGQSSGPVIFGEQPVIKQLARHRLVLSGYVQDIQVDLLVEARPPPPPRRTSKWIARHAD